MWNRLNTSTMTTQMLFGLSFYGVMVILYRLFTEQLGYNEADATMIVGAFSAVGPLFSLAGAQIADRLLGSYRSLFLGLVSFTSGYALLGYGAYTQHASFALAGIALASYGRGMFGPSYPTLLKSTFRSTEEFDKAYPINYSINNVGAFLGQYFSPLLITYLTYTGNFALAAGLIGASFVTMLINAKKYKELGKDLDRSSVSAKNWALVAVITAAMIGLVFFMFSNMEIGKNIVYAISVGAIGYYIFEMTREKADVARKMSTVLIMMVLTVAFFVLYAQMMGSMNIMAFNTMQGDLFGIFPVTPESSMSFNPLWCILGGPVIAIVFGGLEKRGIHLQTATKISGAFILSAIAFAILAFAAVNVGPDMVITPEVYFAVHAFQAIAEVIVGALVVSFILSVVPKRMESFGVAMFYVSMSLSGIVGAVISTWVAMPEGATITREFIQTTYGGFFTNITIFCVMMVAVSLAASMLIKKLTK